MFYSIKLKSPFFERYQIINQEDRRLELSKVNIFIGANNSGKSYLIRGLAKSVDEFKYDSTFYDKLIEEISNLKSEIDNIIIKAEINNISQLFYKTNEKEIDLFALLNQKYDSSNDILEQNGLFKFFKENLGHKYHYYIDKRAQPLSVIYAEQIVKLAREFNKFFINHLQSCQPLKIESLYIPVLRGLRNLGDNVYKDRTVNDYFREKTNQVSLFTGLDLYDSYTKLLLGDHENRKQAREFEKFLSKIFFENNEITIIPWQGDDVVYLKIADEPELPIYDLGDGIQNIICLLFPLFQRSGQQINVFIEEPDLYMHPGYQRIFLKALLERPEFEKMQFFITTHSNHFLDMTLDFTNVIVHSLEKKGNGQIEIVKRSSSDLSLLEMLGVRNSSVFLSNCTIWVEGITDRIYLRKYLELYMKHIKDESDVFNEDIHYSFVEYGGNNIIHWSFLDDEDDRHPNIDVEKLCGKLFLITDKDSDSPNKSGNITKKQERHQKLQVKLGERYYCLRAREIENILPLSTIKSVIEDYEKSTQIDFSKFESEFNPNSGLGEQIASFIDGLNTRYNTKSGTINNKVDFAKKAVLYINAFDDLTEEAKELIIRVYEFIKMNNS